MKCWCYSAYEDILSPNLDNILNEVEREREELSDSSSDYAGDSDDCSL